MCIALLTQSGRNHEGISRGGRAVGDAAGGATGHFREAARANRQGYVPDPGQEEDLGGILLRHESAPDLILRADGTIDLPARQAPRR